FVFFSLFLLWSTSVQAQSGKNAIKITYLKSSNGKMMSNQDPVLLFTSKDQTVLTSQKIIEGKSRYPFERFFIDRNNHSYYKLAEFGEGKRAMTVDSELLAKQKLTVTDETKTILGYKCR